LWIDSLCILQDDAQDWETECDRMAGIYENALITIASETISSPANNYISGPA
jgi:hypothetical protein